MNENNDKHRYDDIINLPHHVSASRQHMKMTDRAAQFAPFAALTGHGAAIEETARLTDAKTELDEEYKTELNNRLVMLAGMGENKPYVAVTYFVRDEKKQGGSYNIITGIPKKIKEFEQELIMDDGTVIPFSDIFDIQSDIFELKTDIYGDAEF